MATITRGERYRRLASSSSRRYGFAIFERFTERARQVVALAHEEARTLRHDVIGTEHLLLGLLREESGLAAQVLDSFGLTLAEAHAHVVQTSPRTAAGAAASQSEMPFTARAKSVLESALGESASLGHNYVGTEHLLLGLTTSTDGAAIAILSKFRISAGAVRQEIVRLLSGPGRRVALPDSEANDPLALLNALGADGWALAATADGQLIFQTRVRALRRSTLDERASHVVAPGVTVHACAGALGVSLPTMIGALMELGQMKGPTNTLSGDEILAVARALGRNVTIEPTTGSS